MSTNYTKLSVTNQQKEAVEVFVTFAAANSKNSCCGSPATVSDFPVLTKVNDLMGKFLLAAGTTQEFDPKEMCFSGNVCFYIEPQCPIEGATFNKGEKGTSIAEFTLNPSSGCDEAFDISCVNGINSFIEIEVDGEGWHYGSNKTPISKIYNKGLGLNSGNPGVFPVNCTDCIRLKGDAPCPTLPVGPAQKERICNIQRTERGGTVNIILARVEPV